eukprot:evm.model.scf_260.2 EVM.evm.TU.scf_260.2   scf_260:6126-8161(+)
MGSAMHWAVVLTLLSVLAAVPGAASDDPTSSLPGVQDLEPDNFDKLVNGQRHALVEFYAPWCGHCKRLTPEYKSLGEKVAADPQLKNRVLIGKVNADEHRTLGSRFGVQGFPTIKYFARGGPVDKPDSYDGPRSADAFLEFLKKKIAEDKGFARVEQLDSLVGKCTTSDDLETMHKELEAGVAKLDGSDKENGKIYVNLIQKAIAKGGCAYFAKEMERLNRMLQSGNVKEDKAEEMNRKVSVLSAFVPDEAEV